MAMLQEVRRFKSTELLALAVGGRVAYIIAG